MDVCGQHAHVDVNADTSSCSQGPVARCYAPLATKKADLIQSYFRGGERGCLVLAVENDVLKT